MTAEEIKDKGLKPLPQGITDYREAATKYCCVDKTLLLRDILDRRTKAFMFTRPSGFGKSMNMSMLRTFLEDTGEDKSVYFRGTKIWSCGERYLRHMGAYPVISLDFADTAAGSWPRCCSAMKKVISAEFQRWSRVADCPMLTQNERELFARIADGSAGMQDFRDSLEWLTLLVYKCTGKKPVLFIDGYDAPLQAAYLYRYLDTAEKFIRPLLAKSITGNSSLEFAILTGIMQPSGPDRNGWGLNSLKLYSVLEDSGFNEYFGFTDAEAEALLEYYGCRDMLETLRRKCGGYRIGGKEMFCPEAVISCLADGSSCLEANADTSHKFLFSVLETAPSCVCSGIRALLRGETIWSVTEDCISYPDLAGELFSAVTVYSLLVMHGYLNASPVCRTAEEWDKKPFMRHDYILSVPNEDSIDALDRVIRRLMPSANVCVKPSGISYSPQCNK